MVVGAFGPMLAAMLLTPRAQRRELWQWRVRGNGVWILAALLCVPVWSLIGALITRPHHLIALNATMDTIGIALLSPVGEEVGWRGYLLPRLDPDRHPLRASVIVGLVWCGWHIPFDGVPPISRWLLLVAWSVLFTALWRRSGRSLAVAVAAHLGIHVARILGLFIS